MFAWKFFSYCFDVWSWCGLYTFRDRNRFPRDKWGFVSLLIRRLIYVFPSVKTCPKKNGFRCDTKWTFLSVDSKEKEIKKHFFFFVYPDKSLWKCFVKTFLLKTSFFFFSKLFSFLLEKNNLKNKEVSLKSFLFVIFLHTWKLHFSFIWNVILNNFSFFSNIF